MHTLAPRHDTRRQEGRQEGEHVNSRYGRHYQERVPRHVHVGVGGMAGKGAHKARVRAGRRGDRELRGHGTIQWGLPCV